MGTITITPGTMTNYRGTSVWSDDVKYLGYVSENASTRSRFRVKLKIVLDKSVKSIHVKTAWRYQDSMNTGYAYNAAMTQTNGTSPPDSADTVFYFNQDSKRTGEFTIEKKMAAGTWYLWLWYTGSEFNAVRGTVTWTITAETAGAGRVLRNGTWKETEAKVYKNGAWKDAEPKEYRNGWGELT